jgi:hypothetical protein
VRPVPQANSMGEPCVGEASRQMAKTSGLLLRRIFCNCRVAASINNSIHRRSPWQSFRYLRGMGGFGSARPCGKTTYRVPPLHLRQTELDFDRLPFIGNALEE